MGMRALELERTKFDGLSFQVDSVYIGATNARYKLDTTGFDILLPRRSNVHEFGYYKIVTILLLHNAIVVGV